MSPSVFQLQSKYQPAGDQPQAIESAIQGFRENLKYQTLLGVTGSGKTFTVANVIQELNLPTLIISHNKTLVAQLYQEFKSFFPKNAVEYFVSYYDYYQPEAYMPTTDTFIEKDSSINEEIEKLRLRTTASLMSRKDVIVVSSVSCIYGLGSPKEYQAMMVEIKVGDELDRDEMLRSLIDIHYSRNDYEFKRATFRVRGDVIEVRPAYDDYAIRIEMFGDEIERLSRVELLTGELLQELENVMIYPARHFVTNEDKMDRVVRDIKSEMWEQIKVFERENKLVELQRIQSRTQYDMEMISETGFCSGIENYSRIIEDREAGTPPHTLMDFFGLDDFLLIIDESHATMPQVRAMYGGDRARKENLVNYGFRLPCAMDNRPLNFSEFTEKMPRTLFVSATPNDYELEVSGGVVIEQVVRPTGLLDPNVEVRPVKGQIDDILHEIHLRVSKKVKERILVLTLTKKSAEDLTDYLKGAGVNCLYMHSDTETLKRTEILNLLRIGEIDVLVGINLLREGLDLPEVSLVVILDADKEGFLRNRRTLIQIMGRAARNAEGKVILYADRVTGSMQAALDETRGRRRVQEEYNKEHSITPRTIIKEIHETIKVMSDEGNHEKDLEQELESSLAVGEKVSNYQPVSIEELEKRMREAADNLDFEAAAKLRDEIRNYKGES